jgi:N-methylhydantoinase B
MTTTASGTEIDVFSAEVIRNGLAAGALEMNKTLKRSAFSPIIYDLQDFGVGIVSATGELWGMAPGQSFFVGLLSDTIKSLLLRWPVEQIEEGDVFLANDPFETGTHISDTSLCVPLFVDGELIAFGVSTAHWADIGGKSPSGWSPDTTDVYQEGLCFGFLKLFEKGHRNEALWQLIHENVRVPTPVIGDLDAQIACCKVGAERTRALCDRYGAAVVRDSMAYSIAKTEAAVRELIAELPDGTYEAAIEMDSDGVSDQRPRVAVSYRIEGDRLIANFDDSSAIAAGPINITPIGTRAAVRTALQAMMLPFERTNEGHLSPFEFEITPGLLTSATRPAPTDSYGYVATLIEELTFRALGEVMPGRAPASGTMLFSIFISRIDGAHGEPFVFLEPVPGGNGASADHDGPTLQVFAIGDCPTVPVEVIEQRYPLRIEGSELETEGAGDGRRRGGMGLTRDYRILEDGIYLQTTMENTNDLLAVGTAGGGTGRPSRVVVRPDTPTEEQIDEKRAFIALEAGDVVRAISGGGGGWGDPAEREPELVAADVTDGLITVEAARATYGVVLEPDGNAWRVDAEATAEVRS